jgi:hypothetical protein
MMSIGISSGDVIRWFCIDWEYFGGPGVATEYHEEIFDALLSIRGAVEVNSGHVGINIAFENIRRANSQVIREIRQRLTCIQKRCSQTIRQEHERQ